GNFIKIWDIAAGKLSRVISLGNDAIDAANLVALSSDGKTIASAGFRIKLYDAATGKLIRMLDNTLQTTSLAFSPDGKPLAASASEDTTVKLWDVGTGKVAHELKGHTGSVASVEFSKDGRWFVSAGGMEVPLP